MKKSFVLLAAVVLALGVTGLLMWSADAPLDATAAAPAASGPAGLPVPHGNPAAQTAALPVPVLQPERESVPLPAPVDQSAPAEVTMAAAREHGDPRAPSITRVKETDEPPTAAELADPKLYQAYERRQSSKAYASYVKAVDASLPVQQAALDAAKAKGMPPEEVARAEDKIRHMQAARDQLLAEHPDVNR
jgi:hypothetical protein